MWYISTGLLVPLLGLPRHQLHLLLKDKAQRAGHAVEIHMAIQDVCACGAAVAELHLRYRRLNTLPAKARSSAV